MKRKKARPCKLGICGRLRDDDSSLMAKPSAKQQYTELSLTSGLGVLAFWWLEQRTAYASLLPLAVPHATPEETLLLHWSVCALSGVFLLPGLCAAVALVAAGRGVIARALFATWSTFALLYLSLDLRAYVSWGRHLGDFVRFLFVPGAARAAGGNTRDWLLLIAPRALLIALGSAALLWLVRRALAALWARASTGFQWLLTCLAPLVLVVALLVPYAARGMFQHRALSAGLVAQLPWVPRAARSAQLAGSQRDPAWAALERDFRVAYARAFPLVFSRRPITLTGRATGAPNERRNALVIVMESLRPDAFTHERMPRLVDWAQHGLVAKQHYGGSNYSEAGLFALLYGRSPLLYHHALDTREPPTWCRVAHSFDLRCAWYSGQPVVWVRQEEFVNAKVIDRFEHDDSGDWNQWDRTALDRAVTAIQKNDAPAISVVYLMSTHFEYRYPPQYEQHLPVLASAHWPKTSELELTAADRVPLSNRYLNALAFSDDLIADALARIDASRALVILTGDHGEALGEDGHFGHGFSFADDVARVPFAMVGPGVPASTLDSPSLHADVVRTIVHWLGGATTGPSETRDLLAPAPPRPSLLLSHASFSQDSADALFIHGARRIRLTLGLQTSDLTMVGPEDERARPIELTPLSVTEAIALREAFDAELASLWRE